MLPQGMSPTVAVDPIHGCEYCDFKSRTLQYPGFPVYDLLNGEAIIAQVVLAL